MRLPDRQRSRAVLIGTGRYADRKLPDLPVVRRTIRDLAAVLTDPVYGVVTKNHCTVLEDRADIRRIGRALRSAANQAADLLLVYFVGHGLVAGRRHDLYLGLPDSEWAEPEFNSLEYDKLRSAVLDSAAATKIIILDCCFSGRVVSEAMADPVTEMVGQMEVDGTYVLASAGRDQVALIQPGEDYTAFTGRFLHMLRNGVPGGPELLTVDYLYRQLLMRMKAEGLSQPQKRGTSTAGLLALAGNRAFARAPKPSRAPVSAPTIIPAPLPESLRFGLDSPHPGIRVGAVTELGEWLTGGDPARAATARLHLQEVADTDISRVARTARTLLDTGTTAEAPTPEPRAREEANLQAPEQAAQLTRTKPGYRQPPRADHPKRAGHSSSKQATSHRPRSSQVAGPGPDASSDQSSSIPRRTRTLTGHKDSVRAVAFSPDGRLLASGSDDNTVRIWDPATGAHQRTLTGHNRPVYAVAFSPDGRLLATAGEYGTARLWDPATGEHRRTLTGHTGAVHGVAFSPDGRLLATAGQDGTARLWDPASGEHRRTLAGYIAPVHGVAFSPDGRLLATAGADRTARLWDPATGEHQRTLTGHNRPVYAVAFSPDGRLLASASDDTTVQIWDPATGEHQRTLTHKDSVRAVAFSPDGRLLASGSAHTKVQIWDPATGEHQRTLTGHKDYVRAVAFSPDGRLLASGSDDNTVRIWDPARRPWR